LSQLSRIVTNNGDSHKSSMYLNVKLPVDIVYCVRPSLPHATR